MAEIKAIETEYNGYKFRSRLEARWAVFFDALGIEYQYEPEGLVLSDGSKYLPDFYLPWFSSYFEVKSLDTFYDQKKHGDAYKKISDGAYTSKWPGIIVYGDPVEYECEAFCQESDDGGGGSYWGNSGAVIGLHPSTHEPYLCFKYDRRDRSFFSDWATLKDIHFENECDYKAEDFVSMPVTMAALKARQARFEHGETPKARR